MLRSWHEVRGATGEHVHTTTVVLYHKETFVLLLLPLLQQYKLPGTKLTILPRIFIHVVSI